jgi:hypothetical protein
MLKQRVVVKDVGLYRKLKLRLCLFCNIIVDNHSAEIYQHEWCAVFCAVTAKVGKYFSLFVVTFSKTTRNLQYYEDKYDIYANVKKIEHDTANQNRIKYFKIFQFNSFIYFFHCKYNTENIIIYIAYSTSITNNNAQK